MRAFVGICVVVGCVAVSLAAEPRERLDRGLVARPVDGGKVYVGWRLLQSDPADVAFNVYRRTGEGKPVKLNAEPIRKTTDFMTPRPSTTSVVRLGGRTNPRREGAARVLRGEARRGSYLSIKLDGNHTFQKVGIADLDGDGRYDFVIKQPNANIDPYEKYWKPQPRAPTSSKPTAPTASSSGGTIWAGRSSRASGTRPTWSTTSTATARPRWP